MEWGAAVQGKEIYLLKSHCKRRCSLKGEGQTITQSEASFSCLGSPHFSAGITCSAASHFVDVLSVQSCGTSFLILWSLVIVSVCGLIPFSEAAIFLTKYNYLEENNTVSLIVLSYRLFGLLNLQNCVCTLHVTFG